MAERGAHLTGTTFAKPTIFEIVAKESLISTLEPAFKKLFSVIIQCNIKKYGWLENWSDEAYAIFHGALENFYLKHYRASFSETFYGLKRIALFDSTIKGKLTWKQEKLSVLLDVLSSYIKSKAQKYTTDELDNIVSPKRWKEFFKTYFVRFHQTFKFIYEACGIYYYLAYMSDYSAYPTPMFRLLSMTLTYSRGSEIISIQSMLMRGLELSAFFLQFINWWNRENFHSNVTSLPVPPPPSSIPENAKKLKGLCPICHATLRIPVALAVSGYVFCYACIFQHIQSHGQCPVTNYLAKEDDLIRIYMNN